MGKKVSENEFNVYMNVFDPQSMTEEDITYINSKSPSTKIYSSRDVLPLDAKQSNSQVSHPAYLDTILSEDFVMVTGRDSPIRNTLQYLSFGLSDDFNVSLLRMDGKVKTLNHTE